MASFFPALESLEEVDEVIAEDIHAATILDATRLPGTPDAGGTARGTDPAWSAPRSWTPIRREWFSDRMNAMAGAVPGSTREVHHWAAAGGDRRRKYLRWSQRAERQAARGNLAGAAIRRARAEYWAPRERAAEAATALREEVHGLVERLQTALGIEGQEPRPWREALLALAHQAPRGLWTVEARLLYDLQKVCVDQGADDLDGRRDAVGAVVGPPADPPRVAQPAAGAGRAAPAAGPAAAASRADLGTPAATACGSAGRATETAEAPAPRELPPQARRRARRSRPAAAEPGGGRLAEEVGRGAARPHRGAGISHFGRGPRRRFAQPSQAARLCRDQSPATSSAATPCCG